MAGLFDFLSPSGGGSSDSSNSDPGSKSSYSGYKCGGCGTPLAGQPALYCDGCGQYYCYACGVPSGDMKWNCPACAIEAQRVNL